MYPYILSLQHNAERLLKLIDEVYRWLPLGTIVNNRVLVVHGGISDSTDLDLIRSLDRGKVSYINYDGMMKERGCNWVCALSDLFELGCRSAFWGQNSNKIHNRSKLIRKAELYIEQLDELGYFANKKR